VNESALYTPPTIRFESACMWPVRAP